MLTSMATYPPVTLVVGEEEFLVDRAVRQAVAQARAALAAEAGGALGVLFRPERHRFESSPASLRLLMSQGRSSTQLELIKAQGGQPGPIALGES